MHICSVLLCLTATVVASTLVTGQTQRTPTPVTAPRAPVTAAPAPIIAPPAPVTAPPASATATPASATAPPAPATAPAAPVTAPPAPIIAPPAPVTAPPSNGTADVAINGSQALSAPALDARGVTGSGVGDSRAAPHDAPAASRDAPATPRDARATPRDAGRVVSFSARDQRDAPRGGGGVVTRSSEALGEGEDGKLFLFASRSTTTAVVISTTVTTVTSSCFISMATSLCAGRRRRSLRLRRISPRNSEDEVMSSLGEAGGLEGTAVGDRQDQQSKFFFTVWDTTSRTIIETSTTTTDVNIISVSAACSIPGISFNRC